MVLENYYENLKTLHVGTMPNRCYYVPLSEKGENSIPTSVIPSRTTRPMCRTKIPAALISASSS